MAFNPERLDMDRGYNRAPDDLDETIDLSNNLFLASLIKNGRAPSAGGDFMTEAWQERDLVKIYLNDIGKIPRLTDEQTYQLASVIQDCQQELEADKKTPYLTDERKLQLQIRRHLFCHELAEANLRLVVNFAKKSFVGRPRTFEFLDLIQAGNIGLLHAVEKFNPHKGFKLSTYAQWWIIQSMRRELDKTDHNIYVPIYITTSRQSLERCRVELTQSLGHQASDEELAAVLGVDSGYIRSIVASSRKTTSLDGLLEAGDGVLASLAVDHLSPNPEETVLGGMHQEELAEEVDALLDQLEPNEAALLRLIVASHPDEALTIEAASQQLGLSRTKARMLKIKAFSKMLRLAYGQLMGSHRPPTAGSGFPEVLDFSYDNQPAMMEMSSHNRTIRLADKSQPPADTDWLRLGYCLKFALMAFYPSRGESTNDAQAVCLECPVKTPCLEYALKHEFEGIWGATTGRIRRQIKKRRLEIRLANAAEGSPPAD